MRVHSRISRMTGAWRPRHCVPVEQVSLLRPTKLRWSGCQGCDRSSGAGPGESMRNRTPRSRFWRPTSSQTYSLVSTAAVRPVWASWVAYQGRRSPGFWIPVECLVPSRDAPLDGKARSRSVVACSFTGVTVPRPAAGCQPFLAGWWLSATRLRCSWNHARRLASLPRTGDRWPHEQEVHPGPCSPRTLNPVPAGITVHPISPGRPTG